MVASDATERTVEPAANVRTRVQGPYRMAAFVCLLLMLACIAAALSILLGVWKIDEVFVAVYLILAVLVFFAGDICLHRMTVTIDDSRVLFSSGNGTIELDVRVADAVMWVDRCGDEDGDGHSDKSEDYLVLLSLEHGRAWCVRGAKFGLSPAMGRWIAGALQDEYPAEHAEIDAGGIRAAFLSHTREIGPYRIVFAEYQPAYPPSNETVSLILPLDE